MAGYNPKGYEVYAARMFLEPVSDAIIGWEAKREILGMCQDVIKETKKQYAQKNMR